MQSKKSNFRKSFVATVKRFFRARNIIIISDHKVDHVPLSASLQVLLLVGMLGFFSGISYITGGYMTARSTIREKDRKLVSTTMEKVRIGEEMDALKHDLVRLGQNGKELSAYGRFLLDEHVASSSTDLGSATPSTQILGQDPAGLADRVSYLEDRIKEIRDEDDRLVAAIRQRTDKRISDFQDIIAMTGLDSDKLERVASADAPRQDETAANAAPALPDAQPLSRRDSRMHGESEGGPFIPYSASSQMLNDSDRELLTNVDRLVLLHDIVEQLPLAMPIENAQMTGPFGKRVDPFNGRWAIHPGLDLAGPIGSRIYATSAGRVIAAGHRAAYGNAVDIDHGFGIVTRYGHMSRIVVKEGDFVRKGQQIGVQGSTGRSTGPHLHYEVRINDRPVNPVKFIHAGEYVSEN